MRDNQDFNENDRTKIGQTSKNNIQESSAINQSRIGQVGSRRTKFDNGDYEKGEIGNKKVNFLMESVAVLLLQFLRKQFGQLSNRSLADRNVKIQSVKGSYIQVFWMR